MIEILGAPLPILKIILQENQSFAGNAVKRHVMSLLLEMLRSLNSYLEASRNWLNFEDHRKLKSLISNYIIKNFLDAKAILRDWETKNINSEMKEANINNEKFLETVFDIFDLYNKTASQLLDGLNSMGVELSDLLQKLSGSCGDEKSSARLQVKMINIFIDLEPANFSLNSELFPFVLSLLFKFYYETVDTSALSVLNKLLGNTGIFEGCSEEVNIWINGILNLRHFDDDVIQGLVHILRSSAERLMDFSEELSLLETVDNTGGNIAKIIEKLKDTEITSDEERIIIKHKYLSPMVLGLVRYLEEVTLTKNLKSYVNLVLINLFHSQTQMEMLAEFVRKYEVIPKGIKEYTLSWTEKGEISFFNHKGRIRAFESFSRDFLSADFENALKHIDIVYPDLPLNLLQTGIFYITNSVNKDISIENVFENCLKFIKHLIELKLFQASYVETVLAHPVLLDHFSLLHLETNSCTKFLLNIVKLLLDSGYDISRYLMIYKEKLLKAILKILKKPKKHNFPNFINTLQLFQLSYEQCRRVLTVFAQSPENDKHFVIISDILSYALKRIASLYESEDNTEPLEPNIVENLMSYFVVLNKGQDFSVGSLSEGFHEYFKVFPHHIKHVNPNLLPSLVNLNEYNKENIALMTFLLERNIQLFDSVKNNLNDLCSKKGVLLPVLEVLVRQKVNDDVLKQIYEQFEPSLTKVLVKPQKAGQHFHVSYRGLTVLIEKFMPLEKCRNFTDKVQKFEATEVFHVKLLETVFNKVIDDGVTSKQVNNIILTFVHLQVQVFKRNVKADNSSTDFSKANDVAGCFNGILRKIRPRASEMDLKNTSQNETLKSYIMYCLKFGISGQTVLLKSLTNMIKVLSNSMEKEEGKLIMDMLLSHSKFMDVVLDEHTPVKLEILFLFFTLCRTWEELMERYHVPVLLAGYRAMINGCDRIIMTLLRM